MNMTVSLARVMIELMDYTAFLFQLVLELFFECSDDLAFMAVFNVNNDFIN